MAWLSNVRMPVFLNLTQVCIQISITFFRASLRAVLVKDCCGVRNINQTQIITTSPFKDETGNPEGD